MEGYTSENHNEKPLQKDLNGRRFREPLVEKYRSINSEEYI